MQFFEGKGYSEKFVCETERILKYLNEKNPELTLVCGCDIICGSCPNNENGKCSANEKVCKIDERCLQKYGLNFGDKIRWNKLKSLAYENIISKKMISEVCRDCEWRSLCDK